MAICFDAIGEKYVTFLAAEGTEQGTVCKLSANDTVGGCGENDVFCGVAAEVKNGCAAVVMGGYVELPYTGTAPSVGYALLAADGKGGVRTAASGGRSCLVVRVDTAEKKIGLFL